MSDREIITALIAKDPQVTRWFFYRKCHPLFMSIIRHLYSYPVEYDEFVDELYALLMAEDARRLRQFDFRSSVYQWIKTVALRHFLRQRDKLIDNTSKDSPYNKLEMQGYTPMEAQNAVMDIKVLLERLSNERYALVIRRLMLEDRTPVEVAGELGVTVANLYNIKKRAITALTRVALADKKTLTYAGNI